MKHELLMMRSLLIASLLVCGLILGNMLTYTGEPVLLSDTSHAAVTCAASTDVIPCARSAS